MLRIGSIVILKKKELERLLEEARANPAVALDTRRERFEKRLEMVARSVGLEGLR